MGQRTVQKLVTMQNKETTNPRKNKILVNLWLTKSELVGLLSSLRGEVDETYCVANICEIIQEAFNRGDLK